ncbi:unnamed protein product [Adineta ricciae]|uniref:Transmembrane protein 267 n=1 Tax=Adineta ricciae TaxID=249248 RepID=A0A814S985_ADIRI|nr:unnamed protein product [Adineta ricciae]
MFLSQRILLIDGLTLVLLCFVSLLGDCLCFGRPWSFYVISNIYARAITDNFTHGLISVVSTCFVFGWSHRPLMIIAFIAGSFVDVDHFIEVRSFLLHRALYDQPRGRPFLHNSLLLLIVTFIVGVCEYLFWKPHRLYYSIVFLLGWSTHHLRDAQRRGLTLTPLKSLTLHNLYLIQSFPENNYAINRLRSIWFENCVNIHFLLSAIDKQYLKTIVVRQSTCDRAVLTTFLDQLETLHYLDLTSLEILQSTNQNDEPLRIPVKLKTCSLNSTLLQNCSFRLASSLRSLELIDINVNQLTNIFKFCQKLRILCLFFITQQLSLSSMIRYFRKHHHRQRLIHFHVSSTTDFDDEKQILPANILIIPTQESARCFCYENLLE